MSKIFLDKFKDAYYDSFPYALDNELMLNWYPKRILQLAKGESVLELGLGHGYTSIIFSKNFKKHLVIDGSREIIEDFRRKFDTEENVNIVHSYFEDYDNDEKYDIIVMGFVLEHVEDPNLIVEKYKKLLKPDGRMFIAVPNSEALNKRIGFEAGLLKDMSALSQADKALGHQRLFTVESLRQLVAGHDLNVITVEGIFLKPITTAQINKLELSHDILLGMLKLGINYPELCVGILMEVAEE